MNKRSFLFIILFCFVSSQLFAAEKVKKVVNVTNNVYTEEKKFRQLNFKEYVDKMKGGWIGQMSVHQSRSELLDPGHGGHRDQELPQELDPVAPALPGCGEGDAQGPQVAAGPQDQEHCIPDQQLPSGHGIDVLAAAQIAFRMVRHEGALWPEGQEIDTDPQVA